EPEVCTILRRARRGTLGSKRGTRNMGFLVSFFNSEVRSGAAANACELRNLDTSADVSQRPLPQGGERGLQGAGRFASKPGSGKSGGQAVPRRSVLREGGSLPGRSGRAAPRCARPLACSRRCA